MAWIDETGLAHLCAMIKDSLTQNLQKAYPVGAVYMSVDSTDPSGLFGFGTWENTGTIVFSDSEDQGYEVYLWQRTA